jgi:glycosyltransferase involved in cell wall biosynthesis
MNILQVMGCTSDQYASMERYLVRKASLCQKQRSRLHVIYENEPASSAFKEDFERAGGILFRLKCSGPIDIRYYHDLHGIIRNHDIDVVHAYFTPTCHYVMMACLLFGIAKRFRTSANLPYTLFQATSKGIVSDKSFRVRQRLLAMLTKKIICRSKAIMAEFEKLGIDRNKLDVAAGGTDSEFFRMDPDRGMEMRMRLGIPSDAVVIGTACRLVPVKSIPIMIDAFSTLAKRRKNIFYVIAGDGPEREKLAKMIDGNKMNGQIKLAGHQNDIVQCLNAFDLFVLPSYSEGMSNSILEAMACGLPIIASDIGPNREIFDAVKEEGRPVGELFKTGDAADLARKLESMMDTGELELFGANARYVVEKRFSITARLEKEFRVYREFC